MNNGFIWAVENKTSLEELRRKFSLPVCPSLDTFLYRAHEYLSKTIIYLRNSHSVESKRKTEREKVHVDDRLSTPLLPTSNDEEITQPSPHALLETPLLLSNSVSTQLCLLWLVRMSRGGVGDFLQKPNLSSRAICSV